MTAGPSSSSSAGGTAPYPQEAIAEAVTIHTRDGFPIAAHAFRPSNGSDVRAILIIANATGVQARFYHDFARWSATQGVLALTFDYRFSGASFLPKHKQALEVALAKKSEDGGEAYDEVYEAALHECPETEDLTNSWTRKDLHGVVLYARHLAAELRGSEANAAHLDLTIMGHSLGGHLHVLLDPEFVAAPAYSSIHSSTRRVNRFMIICSGNAHWRNHPKTTTARFAFQNLIQEPLREEGIFRASSLGLGFDLPKGPGEEWLDWYFHPLFSLERRDNEARARENSRTTPVTYYGFEDDESIGPLMMERYLSMMDCSTGNVQSLRLNPKELPGWPVMGHVNCFQPGNGTGTFDAADGDKAVRGGEAYHSTDLTKEAMQRQQQLSHIKTRAETIWPVYLDHIVTGRVQKELGAHRIWTAADEMDRELVRRFHAEMLEREAQERVEYEEEEELEGDDQREDEEQDHATAEGQQDLHRSDRQREEDEEANEKRRAERQAQLERKRLEEHGQIYLRARL